MKCLYLLAVLLLISACAQQPKKDTPIDQAWRAHQKAVAAIRGWDMQGRLAMRHKNASGTISIRWQQDHDAYQLRFTTLLAQKTYTLTSTANGVILQGTDTDTLTASSPEQLMIQTLGWSVWLEGLRYWLIGLPAPTKEYGKLILDENARLLAVQQAGFNIKISRYIEKNGIALPKKITINNDHLHLKLVIQNWNL